MQRAISMCVLVYTHMYMYICGLCVCVLAHIEKVMGVLRKDTDFLRSAHPLLCSGL